MQKITPTAQHISAQHNSSASFLIPQLLSNPRPSALRYTPTSLPSTTELSPGLLCWAGKAASSSNSRLLLIFTVALCQRDSRRWSLPPHQDIHAEHLLLCHFKPHIYPGMRKEMLTASPFLSHISLFLHLVSFSRHQKSQFLPLRLPALLRG
jgi:hypothetical protein